MPEYTMTLPKHIALSPHNREKADGYLKVLLYGKTYYVPLTREMKRAFRIHRRGAGVSFDSFGMEMAFDDIVRTVIDATYLQVRDTVGAEIKEDVLRLVNDRMQAVLEPQIDKELDRRFEQKERPRITGGGRLQKDTGAGDPT
jgi:hypothetical protein